MEPQILVDRAIALSQLNEPEIIELGSGNKIVYPDLRQSIAVEQLVEWGKSAIAKLTNFIKLPELPPNFCRIIRWRKFKVGCVS
ncbi:hypothetical protein [Tychonema sp. BBK16]|uniref:hypothetical protein n=1 Tax=Tychonema sp. BBK16 TaxID=2699888 RepID=UPI0030DCF059